MTDEFDVGAAIREVERITTADKGELPITVTGNTGHAQPLAAYLSHVSRIRQIAMAKVPLSPDLLKEFKEGTVAVFSRKICGAVCDNPEPKYSLVTTRLELNEVGEFLLKPISKSADVEVTDLIRPVRASFVVVNWEFVRAGGVDNTDLTYKLMVTEK